MNAASAPGSSFSILFPNGRRFCVHVEPEIDDGRVRSRRRAPRVAGTGRTFEHRVRSQETGRDTDGPEKGVVVVSQSELNGVVAEILEVPSSEVSDESDLEELGWDSLSNMTFISIADERYRARIDPQGLAQAETPAQLLRLFG